MATLGSVLSFNMQGRALNSGTQAGLEHPYPRSHLTGPVFMNLRWAKTGPQLVMREDDLDPASSTSQGLRLQTCCGHGAVDGTQGLLHALLTE